MALEMGQPQTATSYASSTSETPKWMQDAIYNQIQWAQQLQALPYQEYALPNVADPTALQQQAYGQIQANQGAWKPAMSAAQTGMQGLASSATAPNLAAAQNPYLGQNYLTGEANKYVDPYQQGVLGAMAKTASIGTSNLLEQAQNPYLQAGAPAAGSIGTGVNTLESAANQNILGSAQPYFSQALNTIGGAGTGSALNAANPYLQSAGQSSVSDIGQYMNPYQQNVLDTIAKQGSRNLYENLLPNVSDAFIKAGQFGSGRMGEFGSRALRDTQEAILNAQSAAAQQGYSQALGASSTDLARQAQLAGTTGQLSTEDLNRMLQSGVQTANIGQNVGSMTGQQMQNMANIGQSLIGAGQAQQNVGLTAAGNVNAAAAADLARQMGGLQNMGTLGAAGYNKALETALQQQGVGLTAAGNVNAAQAADYARQMSALQNMGALAQTGQGMGYADTAALEAAGAEQYAIDQAKMTAAKQQYQAGLDYPWQQLNNLMTITRGLQPSVPTTTTTTGTTSGQTYSPSVLAQLGSLGAAYKGFTQ